MRGGKRKAVLNWLLAGLLLLPYTGQSLHSLHHTEPVTAGHCCSAHCEKSPTGDGSEDHDSESCPVCQFHYAVFTGQSSINPVLSLPVRDIPSVDPLTPTCRPAVHSVRSRGPPAEFSA